MSVTIHPQTDWELPTERISGPAPKGAPGTWVIHYPGSPSLYEPMTDSEMVASLRAAQGSYLASRGYSYGYSVVASQSGSLWAVRGIEGYGHRVYNPASNPGRKVAGNMNDTTRSIQIAVGGQNKASDAAVNSVNALIATQPDWDVIWHGQIDWTSCAGDGIIEQIKQGIIGHQAIVPPLPESDIDMLSNIILWKVKGTTNVFCVSPMTGGAIHLGAESYKVLVARLAAAGLSTEIIESQHPQEIKSVLHLAGIALGDLEQL